MTNVRNSSGLVSPDNFFMLLLLILTADCLCLGLQTELQRMDEEMKENLHVKGVLMESLIGSLTEVRNQIPQIKPRDK